MKCLRLKSERAGVPKICGSAKSLYAHPSSAAPCGVTLRLLVSLVSPLGWCSQTGHCRTQEGFLRHAESMFKPACPGVVIRPGTMTVHSSKISSDSSSQSGLGTKPQERFDGASRVQGGVSLQPGVGCLTSSRSRASLLFLHLLKGSPAGCKSHFQTVWL